MSVKDNSQTSNTEQPIPQKIHDEGEGKKPFHLVLSPGHPLSELWVEWCGAGKETPPHLNLTPPGSIVPNYSLEEYSKEKAWIEMVLERGASNCLQQISQQAGGDMDEVVMVFPSSDEMAGWMLLLPPMGNGRELTVSEIQKDVQAHGISYGVDWNVLCDLSGSKERWFRLILVAQGKAPVAGTDGRVEDCYPREVPQEIPVDVMGEADYNSLGLVQEIQENEVICHIVPPSRGVPGHTVTGKLLPAPAGQAAQIPQGRNTQVREDGCALVAQQRGHIRFNGREFQVKPVLELFEEDIRDRQRINFYGDIHIRCDIEGGRRICAAGCIQIDGVVEDCTVEAGESIVLSSGVQGQDRVVLRAQKSVYAKYLEHCHVYAVENVYAECVIGCKVYCNGWLNVRTGRGAVVGGNINAGQGVSASVVGSKAERPMPINLGGKPCEEAERVEIIKQIQAMEQQLENPRKETEGASVLDYGRLKLDLCVARVKLDKMERELESEKDAEATSSREKCRLLCDTAYPGVAVTLGREVYRVTHEEHKCEFGFSMGGLGRI